MRQAAAATEASRNAQHQFVEETQRATSVVQAGAAELIAPGRYRLTRLLRGQRGTEHAIGNPAPAGARAAASAAAAS